MKCVGRVIEALRAGAVVVAAFAFVTSGVRADTIAGGGYVATNDTSYAFRDITSTGTKVLGPNDDLTTLVALPFAFTLYGTTYTTGAISNNGYVQFPSNASTFVNGDLSAVTSPMVAALWDDWFGRQSGSAVYAETFGDAGSRQYVVEWYDQDHFGSSPSTATFELTLYEGLNDIKFNYADVITGDYSDNGGSATVGIGSSAGNLQWSLDSQVIGNGEAILFGHGTADPDASAVPLPAPAVAGAALLAAVAVATWHRRRRGCGPSVA